MMTMRFLRNAASCALILLLTSVVAWAQATAQLSGTVRDESGAVLPGVTVTVTQTDTGFTRTVGDRRERELPDAEPANRSVSVGGVAAGIPHLRPDRHRAAGCRHADDQCGAGVGDLEEKRHGRSGRARSWTCEAPASARWSSRSGFWSFRSRGGRSRT